MKIPFTAEESIMVSEVSLGYNNWGRRWERESITPSDIHQQYFYDNNSIVNYWVATNTHEMFDNQIYKQLDTKKAIH